MYNEDVEMDFVGTHAPRADLGTLEPDSDDEESARVLARLGYSTKRRWRKPPGPTHQAMPKEATVSDIYIYIYIFPAEDHPASTGNEGKTIKADQASRAWVCVRPDDQRPRRRIPWGFHHSGIE